MIEFRLKDLILSSGKSQKEISSDLNISQQRFNFYVNGKRQPDLETVCMIAKYFDVTPNYLLGVEAKEKPPPDAEDGLTDDQRYLIQAIQSMPIEHVRKLRIILDQVLGEP